MSLNNPTCIVRWTLAAGLLLGAGAFVQAQQNEAQDNEGNVVQIGRADEAESRDVPENGQRLDQPGFPEQQELPKYWIGLLGGPIPDDHVLRAHLDLPTGEGVLVENVVPDSPAGKAGLKRHDILLRANDKELRDMRDLVELVRTEGEKEGQIAIEVLRHGERETVYVTPEERPADAGMPQGGMLGGDGQLPPGFPNDLLRQLEQEGRMPFNFRNFGPGVVLEGGRGMANMPNGVSISIQKQEGEPTHITVKRGDETWEVSGDDPESLKQLPDDLRPFVERMLRNNGAGGAWLQLPNMEGVEGRFGDERLQERLEQMERRMEEMQRRIFQNDQQPAEEEPQAEHAEEN